MLSTLSNGHSGLRTTLHIDIRPPRKDDLPSSGKDELPRVPDQPILDFIASDESLDRYDEIICASGWRLESYRRNPVFQNAHQYGDILFTIGKALITEVRVGPERELASPKPGEGGSPHLFQRIQFATDVNPIARIAYGLYQGKFLSAVSVGFIPLRWVDSDGVEHTVRGVSRCDSDLPKDRIEIPPEAQPLRAPHGGRPPGPPHVRRRYLEQELLEVSAVGIPANPNALSLALKSGAVTKSDLVETLDLLRCLTIDYGPWRPPEPLRSAIPGSAGVPPAPPFNLQPSTCNQQLLTFARELHRILRRA